MKKTKGKPTEKTTDIIARREEILEKQSFSELQGSLDKCAKSVKYVATKSKNLKGGLKRDLNVAAAEIAKASEIIAARTTSADVAILQARNASMHAELNRVNHELALVKEMLANVTNMPSHPPVQTQRKEAVNEQD